MTAWRIRIVPDATVDGVAIQIARPAGSLGAGVIQRMFADWCEEHVEPGAAMPAPSLVLDDDLARLLLDALAEHYGGASSGRAQRADYEHERGRVDRLIDSLIAIATEEPAYGERGSV